MAERDAAQHKADLDWLYRRGPDGQPAPAPETTKVINIGDEADLARREASYLAQRQAAAAAAATSGRVTAEPMASEPSTRSEAGLPPHAGAVPPAASAPAPRPRKRHRGRRIVATLLVLIVALAAWLIGVPLRAWNNIKQVDEVPTSGTRPPLQPGTAILLIGTDTRDNLTSAQQAQLGTGDDVGTRTDTMMILYTPPKGRPVLVSLPRDSWVPIPGHGVNKINAAYTDGGPKLMVQTVEQATGVRMDGYLEIGFAGFANIVDAVGGVPVCLDKPMVDKNSNINLPTGCQTLDGPNALGYVRQRYQDPRGDLGRVQRQRQVIAAIGKKALTPSTVLNPPRYLSLSDAFSAALTRGTDTDLKDVIPAARGFLAVSQGKGLSMTVPISDPNYYTPDGQSAVRWDKKRASALFDMMAKGDTSQMDQFVS